MTLGPRTGGKPPLEEAASTHTLQAPESLVPRVDVPKAVAQPDDSSSVSAPTSHPKAESKRDWSELYLLSTPLVGRCRFDDCLKNGWDGEVRADCRFADCAKNGWSASSSAGSSSTDCAFSDCFKNGWSTRLPEGERADVSCNFGKCLEDGFTTRISGERIESRCSFGDCLKNGWEASLPSGKRLSCSCSFGDCVKNGASCR